MKKIIVGFSTPKKFHIFPTIIKLVEGTKFTHSYVKIISEGLERTLIYQASGLKVNFMGLETFDSLNTVIEEYELTISEETYKKVLQFAIDNVGVEYNFSQAVGFLYVRFMSLFNIRVENPIKDGKKEQICTQLVADVLKECLGVDIKESTDSIGLQELHKYVKEISKNG